MNRVQLVQDPITTTIYYHDSTNYDDLRFPLQGQRLDTSSGRIDYNYDECTVDFALNARYPNEPICFVSQMPHAKAISTKVHPHLHWIQEEANVPNWVMAYRWYSNNDVVPAVWTLAKYSVNTFTYVAGDLAQITTFPDINAPELEGISSILDIKLFRDSANTSTLFAGADPYTVVAKAKEFDLHYQINSVGSGEEYTK